VTFKVEGLNVERSTLNLELKQMENIARWLVIGGIVLILIGGGIFLAGRLGLPIGRLPGDIRMEGRGGIFYFPIVTSCVLSLLLTVVLNIIIRFFNR
jgi:hypothetical protein